MRKDFLELFMGLIMVAVVFAAFHFLNDSRETAADPKRNFCVVLDAGHGGSDPGKIGVDGIFEKDINMSLVKQIQSYLEADDIVVYLTREGDNSLEPAEAVNKKRADLEARCQIVDKKEPDIVISIHQNSYHEESVQGPQVFYYVDSKDGKKLAEIVQDQFDSVPGVRNFRKAKGNREYYLLLHTERPVIIVECGFLSNWEECKRLQNPEYQDKIAWAIHNGVIQYLNGM